MNRKQVDLRSAEAIYAVSNAPLFLLGQLRTEAATQELASALSAAELLNEIKAVAESKPMTLRDAVAPYVLLAALEKKRDLSALKEATTIKAPYHDWFAYLASALVQLFSPLQEMPIFVPGQLAESIPANTSTAPTTSIIIKP